MSWNIAEFVESELLARFGFSIPEKGRPIDGHLERRVDAQHVVVVALSRFHRGDGVGERPSFDVRLGRRDINELRAEVMNPVFTPWDGSLRELPTRSFLDRPPTDWNSDFGTTQDEVVAYLDQWIPSLDSIANLAYIEEYISVPIESTGELGFPLIDIPNRMLWGWDVAQDEGLLENQLASVQQFKETHPQRELVEGYVAKMRAWIEEHPAGIERDLV